MTPETLYLQPNGWVPNNPRLPVLLYRNVMALGSPEEMASGFERLFQKNGWPPRWRDGVYAFDHYHPRAHELLGFAAGWARLVLGGSSGREVRVTAGDAALLPAGTGHRQIEASQDFLVIGAYPPQQDFAIRRETSTVEIGQHTTMPGFPDSDPVEGAGGPLLQLWPRSDHAGADTATGQPARQP